MNIAPEILVVAAIIEKDGRILAAQRPARASAANLWEFPGGKVEAGEDERHALARELEEELGIKTRPEEELGQFVADVEGRSIRLRCYWTRWVAGDLWMRWHQNTLWCLPQELAMLPWAAPDVPAVQLILASKGVAHRACHV